MTDAGEGRNIDLRVGMLEGEASSQRVPADRARGQGSAPFDVWQGPPSGRDGPSTYYDRPTLKEPVWIWAVPVYFWIGGAAGAAATIAAAATGTDRDGYAGLISKARRTAAAGCALGSALLIYDLGRPERFLNMLRVFRPTSALNMGSWFLAASGSTSGLAAVATKGRAKPIGDAAGAAAGILGLPLSGYTAVLLSDTSVPLWQSGRTSLPVLFVSSALSSAADLLEMGELADHEEEVVRRLGLVGKVVELAAMLRFESDARAVEQVGKPLGSGLGGSLWRAAKGLTAAALVGSLVARGRSGRVASSLLGTAGALALRFALFHAGKASARDPRAVSEQQRSKG